MLLSPHCCQDEISPPAPYPAFSPGALTASMPRGWRFFCSICVCEWGLLPSRTNSTEQFLPSPQEFSLLQRLLPVPETSETWAKLLHHREKVELDLKKTEMSPRVSAENRSWKERSFHLLSSAGQAGAAWPEPCGGCPLHPAQAGRSSWTPPGKGKCGNTFSNVLWGCSLLFSSLLFFPPPYFPQVLDPEVLKEDSGLQNLQASGESDFIAR